MISIMNNFFEETLKIGNDFFYHIVIENPGIYRNFVRQLNDSISNSESFFEVKENGNRVELSSIAVLVKNPLFMDIDEKKLSTTIQKNIASQINDEEIQAFKRILGDINEWITTVSIGYDVPISFNTNLSPAAFLKAFSVSSSECNADFVELFIHQIKKLAMTLNKKLFIVLNARDSFWPDEMEMIFHELNRHDIHILFCSGHSSNSFSDSEKVILIDKDLAELHLHE